MCLHNLAFNKYFGSSVHTKKKKKNQVIYKVIFSSCHRIQKKGQLFTLSIQISLSNDIIQ